MSGVKILNKLSETLMNYVEAVETKYEKNEASSYELSTMIEASKVLVEISRLMD